MRTPNQCFSPKIRALFEEFATGLAFAHIQTQLACWLTVSVSASDFRLSGTVTQTRRSARSPADTITSYIVIASAGLGLSRSRSWP